jgi:hypothetical protein
MPEFKSLFATNNVSSDLIRDLPRFAKVAPEPFRQACALWPKDSLAFSDEARDRLEELGKAHGVPLAEFTRAISVAQYIWDRAMERKDSLESVVDDLVALGVLKPTDRDSALEKLRSYGDSIGEQMGRRRLLYEASQVAFPRYDSLVTRVAVAVGFRQEYDIRTDDPATYKPGDILLLPLTVLRLSYSEGGEDEAVTLSLTEDELDDVIKSLCLARAQLRIAKEKIS